jgi:transposase
LKEQWCIPSVGAEFVWRMEDVLDLYAEPFDPSRPVVCFDECPVQLVGETRTPVSAAPKRKRRVDYDYRRNGTANVFMLVQPRAGWREVTVTERRTKRDFAEQMRRLVDEHFPTASRIRVVLDNLNTHGPAALYETFAPAEARRLTQRLEFHYTPLHGSWLNMAELELASLARQCLGRRLPDTDTLETEVQAWQAPRNARGTTISWRFTVDNARLKLHRLYPS